MGEQCDFAEIKVMPGIMSGTADKIVEEIAAPKEKIKIPCLLNNRYAQWRTRVYKLTGEKRM
jgi:hypothetical protein